MRLTRCPTSFDGGPASPVRAHLEADCILAQVCNQLLVQRREGELIGAPFTEHVRVTLALRDGRAAGGLVGELELGAHVLVGAIAQVARALNHQLKAHTLPEQSVDVDVWRPRRHQVHAQLTLLLAAVVRYRQPHARLAPVRNGREVQIGGAHELAAGSRPEGV